MYQVKLFNIQNQDLLEQTINTWLKENKGIELMDIKYNIDDNGEYALLIYKKLTQKCNIYLGSLGVPFIIIKGQGVIKVFWGRGNLFQGKYFGGIFQ